MTSRSPPRRNRHVSCVVEFDRVTSRLRRSRRPEGSQFHRAGRIDEDPARRERRGQVAGAETDSRPAAARFRARCSSTGSAWTTMPEAELLEMRSDIGMVFQENALFDSLTVAENVGYRLYEETEDAARSGARAGRGGARVPRPRRFHRPDAGDALRRPAPARRHRARDGVEAQPDAVRRLDDRPRSGHRLQRGRRDRQAARPAAGHVDRRQRSRSAMPSTSPRTRRSAPTAGSHRGRRRDGPALAEFMVLHEGRIHFHGTAAELLASTDPYLERFLYRTLPPW